MLCIDQVEGLPRVGPSYGVGGSASGYTVETALETIEAGDDWHNASLFLTMKGVPKAHIVEAFERSPARDDPKRAKDWRTRVADLDRLYAGAGERRLKQAQRRFAKPASIPVQAAHTPAVELETFTAASLDGQPIPMQEWLVRDLIPAGQPALLSGDGGLGKSLLALQLCVAVATRKAWLSRAVANGPALYLSAEDETAEIHRRLVKIAKHLNVSLNDLSQFHIAPLADRDALLATPQGGVLKATALFEAVARHVDLRNAGQGPDAAPPRRAA